MHCVCTGRLAPGKECTTTVCTMHCSRAKMEQLQGVAGLLPGSQGHNLALTVLHVPNLLQISASIALSWCQNLSRSRLYTLNPDGDPPPMNRRTQHFESCTLHFTSYTLHPTPYTWHPTPYTLRPAPHTLHPAPYALYPTPNSLHPAPYTPTPNP